MQVVFPPGEMNDHRDPVIKQDNQLKTREDQGTLTVEDCCRNPEIV